MALVYDMRLIRSYVTYGSKHL